MGGEGGAHMMDGYSKCGYGGNKRDDSDSVGGRWCECEVGGVAVVVVVLRGGVNFAMVARCEYEGWG